MSRAKSKLYLSFSKGNFRGEATLPSRFIDEINPDTIDTMKKQEPVIGIVKEAKENAPTQSVEYVRASKIPRTSSSFSRPSLLGIRKPTLSQRKSK